ncbi:MAG: hypothetical protein CL402_09710 [Acidiferrobacteraceae bacterium]|nr:hypothetical protein [Acidiferrobacteraceae bacterium]
MNILGVHCALNQFNHDPGAALISRGNLIAVCEEERFSRTKSSRAQFPYFSIQSVLREGGLTIRDIDILVTTGNTKKSILGRYIEQLFCHYFGSCPELRFVDHQDSHLASAFFYSKYSEAMCISYDGIGDGLSGKLAVGRGNQITTLENLTIDQSLGHFYSAMTAFLGFRPLEDEYKVMGLASYGQYQINLDQFIQFTDTDYRINTELFNNKDPLISLDQPLYNKNWFPILGQPRLMGDPIEQRHKNIAYAAQKCLERAIVILVERLHRYTKLNSLCLSGGVGLNCSANKVVGELPFINHLFVQPASSDRGLPLGSALIEAMNTVEGVTVPNHVYFGPTYTDLDHRNTLDVSGLKYQRLENPSLTGAKLLAEGKIIAWYQGRSEFGPRALGNRSILADPRRSSTRDAINARIKFREEFRPFAPAILEEEAQTIFYINNPSPYMTSTFSVRPSWIEKLGAVTHVDGTARVQTVHKDVNPRFYNLINEFGNLTGVPVVLNTSFNARGEPIVETPANALATFYSVGLDALILGDYLVLK